ncbi:hypothetical protein [Mesobacterium pallidum]|uniref:hypothetical protein n=1 Tax=Mesobacterium pallidum TaxID=2872037 RepID=UPI001EE33606|nr:hypothetical protein [Mesobacterium pallidum]
MTIRSDRTPAGLPILAPPAAPVTPTPGTGAVLIDGIAGTTAWGETTLSYAFAEDSADFATYMADSVLASFLGGVFRPLDGSTALDAALKADILRGLDGAARGTGLTLTETAWFGGAATDLRFVGMDGLYSDSNGTATAGGTLTDLSGIASFPGQDPAAGGGFEAHVVLDTLRPPVTVTPEIGAVSARASIALQETLKALGLAHPHDTGNGSTAWASSALTGDNPLDNDRYTVMSFERGGLDVSNLGRTYGYAATPMALDLAALQRMYGARTARIGDSTYTLTDAGTAPLDLDGDTVSIGRAFATIWDTGGTDAIVYGGSQRVLINLNPATLDAAADPAAWTELLAQMQSMPLYNTLLPVVTATELRADLENPAFHAGGFFSRIFDNAGRPVLGGYAIASSAHGGGLETRIENATGSNGNDLLIGNDTGNLLTGNNGDDLALGGRGADTLLGGGGNDQLHGGAWHDWIDGEGGVDLLIGGDGDDTLIGGAGRDTMQGGAGDDTFLFFSTSTSNWNEEMDGGAGRDRVLMTGGQGALFDLRGAIFTDVEEIAFEEAGADVDRVVSIREDRLPNGGTFTLRGTAAEGATERLVIDMTGGALDLSGITLANWGTGGDMVAVIGTAGNNTITGTGGGDDLDGQDGDDTLLGGTGGDILRGALGNDWLEGQAGDDLQSGAEGDDTLLGGWGNDDLRGEDGYDSLEGGDGDDVLDGGAYRDTVLGGDGNDTIRHLNGGFDIYDGGAGEDLFETNVIFVTGVQLDLESGLYTYTPTNFTHYWTGFEHYTGLGSTSSEAVLGTAGNNRIVTGNGNNRLEGRSGSDTLLGGAGRDTLDGGWGADSVEGGEGDDLVIHRVNANDTYRGGAGTDTIEAYVDFADGDRVSLYEDQLVVGNDTMTWAGFETYIGYGAGHEAVHGTEANNLLVTGAGNNRIYGRNGADTIRAGAGNDTINGMVGSDQVDAGAGDDLVIENTGGVGTDINDGGAGRDTIDWSALDFAGAELDMAGGTARLGAAEEIMENFEVLIDAQGGNTILGNAADNEIDGQAGDDVISGADGADTLIGGLGADTLAGEGGADLLQGGADSDVLSGGTGADTLDGGDSRDTMDGGWGDDVYHADRWGDVVVETSKRGGWDVVIAAAGYALPVYLDALVLLGTGDSYGGGNWLANEITGNAGNNLLIGAAGNDTLHGNDGMDTLAGGDGKDRLYGGDGDDSLDGGEADDLAGGGAGQDLLLGGAGDDTLQGGTGRDTLDGGAGDDSMVGGADDDLFIVTEAGDAVIEEAFGGQDSVEAWVDITLGGFIEEVTLLGTAREAYGNGTDNIMTGTNGGNTLDGRAGDDLLTGLDGDDSLRGGTGNDTLIGGKGGDTLNAMSGDDVLDAGSSGDKLNGGRGNDTITTGFGADQVRMSKKHGHDVVTDFDPAFDMLMLEQKLWAGSKTAAQVVADHASVSGGNTFLDFDEESILLLGVTDLAGLVGAIDFL